MSKSEDPDRWFLQKPSDMDAGSILFANSMSGVIFLSPIGPSEWIIQFGKKVV